jgi:superfamily II DNA helicase RecQ
LVVEPLQALVDALESQLHQKGLKVEVLLSEEKARAHSTRAKERLFQLLHSASPGPLILLATAELVEGCMTVISKLVEKGLLSLVVMDEFDYIDKATQNFRSCYASIVGGLKNATSLENQPRAAVPFLYLSATASEGLIKEILQAAPMKPLHAQHKVCRSVICVGEEIIPPSHVYSGKCVGQISECTNTCFSTDASQWNTE